jgi:hypothetical protein
VEVSGNIRQHTYVACCIVHLSPFMFRAVHVRVLAFSARTCLRAAHAGPLRGYCQGTSTVPRTGEYSRGTAPVGHPLHGALPHSRATAARGSGLRGAAASAVPCWRGASAVRERATRGYSTALAGGRRRRSPGWVFPGTPAVPLGSLACAAAAARPRAERAVRSCAGAYVSGAAGSNACPAGSVRIEAEAACRTAVAAAGKTPGSTFVGTYATYPRGCYYYGIYAWFNTHAVGAGRSDIQLLCAALATTGAPLTHHASVRARVDWATLAGGVHNNATNGRHRDTRTYINRYLYTCIYPYDADGARRQCRAAAQADGGRRARGLSRALRGTARVCNDVRVLQGHSRVLTGTPRYSNSTHGYSHRTVQLAAHRQRSVGARAAARVRRGRHCTAGTARQALHGRHSMAVLKEYHISHEPCSTNS